jgi:hypothetical protein
VSESNERESFEIVIANADADKLTRSLNGNVEVKQRAADVLMIVDGEENVEEALRAAHDAGGKLISINPIRRSLEDLFVRKPGISLIRRPDRRNLPADVRAVVVLIKAVL